MVTVFTPTYNRAYILPELYVSLCNQTCQDFEWLIIDDGSIDNTEQIVNGFLKENKITIRYFRQPNGGKHRAINRGLKEASGDWFFIVDSDDRVTPDTVEWIHIEGEKIKWNKDFAGLSGIRITPAGQKIGGGRDFGTIDSNAIDIRLKHNVTGDLAEIYKTDVLRLYPFPEFEGEKFCPEALVWNRISLRFKMRYIHKGIYICEYLNDGLTANIIKVRRNSPIASMTFYSEYFHLPLPTKQKIRAAVNFWRFAKFGTYTRYGMFHILSLLSYPVGKFFRHRDLRFIR